MTQRDEKFKLDHYINLTFKHRWLIIIPFCLAMIVGIYLSIALPRVYQASTLILIKPQQVDKAPAGSPGLCSIRLRRRQYRK
jgi:uncharacterized protein involved in exopolysaccharide biosynthesis